MRKCRMLVFIYLFLIFIPNKVNMRTICGIFHFFCTYQTRSCVGIFFTYQRRQIRTMCGNFQEASMRCRSRRPHPWIQVGISKILYISKKVYAYPVEETTNWTVRLCDGFYNKINPSLCGCLGLIIKTLFWDYILFSFYLY